MTVTILGIQDVNYVSRKTNQQVTGTTFHVCYPKKEVSGEAVETVFISSRSDIDIRGVKVGDTADLTYNRWGSVENLVLLGS